MASNICTNSACENKLKNLSVHRTKCTGLIKNVIDYYTYYNIKFTFTEVISRAFKEELKNELNNCSFLLLIDEWSDMKMQPHLGVIVQYFSKKHLKTKTMFLGIIELDGANADMIYEKLELIITDFDLNMNNMIGFGSDGANVVSGRNNSVWTRIKEDAKYAMRFPCICHSLDLVVSDGFNVLPSRLSVLLKKVPAWFSKRFKHKQECLRLFEDFKSKDESVPNPFATLSQTRWISRGPVIERILKNWDALKEYFLKIL